MVQDDSSDRRLPADEDGEVTQTAASSRGTPGGLPIRCPHCHHPFQIVIDASLTDIRCDACGARFNLVEDGNDTRAAESITRIEHFELIERVGIGSFGTVWKARDTKLQRTVAIKIPRFRHLDPEEAQKFLREARSAAQLDHPHVIRVHEVGRSGETFYLVTEYVRGIPLSDWLTQHRVTGREAAMLLRTMAEAVHHAHEAGVIHRDLKPQNILIDADGEPHVMDFGLARRQANDVTMTVDGQVLGTPAYMSPEQALGEGHNADRRSDVYSLGVILFQLLTGELPFRGNANVIIHQVLRDDPPSPHKLNGTIDRDVETICLKCLEKDPDRRYASAQQLADDLDRFARGVAVQARPINHFDRGWRWCKRKPIIAGLLGTVFLLLLAGIGVSSYFAIQANRNERRADLKAMEATAALYDSLVRGSQATRVARVQGYRDDVWEFIGTARGLTTPSVDLDELRQEAIAVMGDFVGLRPVVCEGFGSDIVTVALTPNGRQLAVGLADGTIWLCDATTGQQRTRLGKHAATVIGLRFAATGARLISADRRGGIRVWQWDAAQAWRVEKTLRLPQPPSGSAELQQPSDAPTGVAAPQPAGVGPCHISSDGDCVTVVQGETIEIWSLAQGKRLARLSTLADGVSVGTIQNIALDPAKGQLAGAYADPSDGTFGFVIWDIASERIRHRVELDLDRAYPHSIAFSSDSKRLVIGFDQGLTIYAMEPLKQLTSRRLDSTKAIALSPDGQFLATVNIRGRVTVWNAANNREIAALANWRKRQSNEDLVFSADGSHLAVSNAQAVRVWWLTGATERMALPGHTGGVPSVAFSPTDSLLVSAGKDRRVGFWDPVTGAALPGMVLPGKVQSVTFSADGHLLAVAYWESEGNGIALVDVATKQILLTRAHSLGWVYSLQICQRGATLQLAAAGVGGVVIWQIETPPVNSTSAATQLTLREIARPYAERSIHVAVSPDCRWLAWVHHDSAIDLWDMHAAELRTLQTPRLNQGWHGLVFFPDSRRLTFVTDRGVADVWDVVQDKKTIELGDLDELINPHIALSADGHWLAGVVAPSAISVWSTTSAKRFFVLRTERSSIMSIAWNPQADKLAVGLADGGISLWDIKRIRAELAQLKLDWTGECPGGQDRGSKMNVPR